jgi:CubicO group peptidase (beta-lactamase class C family)
MNKKISYYLPEIINSNKKDITIKDILTHQAGLWPFVPFWIQTKRDSLFMPQYYSKAKSVDYPFQVAPHLFATKSMRDSIWTWIVQSKMREKAPRTPYNYTYSDIGLYLMFRLNERLLNQNQDEFLSQNLYEPLGAQTMGYLPLNRFPEERIAPTEVDKQFRNEVLIGTVHDEGAAMNGGIAGHAGLFGTANDLAKLGQMMLQDGFYGGIQYYKPGTVSLFTSQQFETSRRGLGWDKPVLSDWNTPTSMFASPKTFGHTGFTGTCIWVDPEFDLVYVFLSNRVYPSRNENKLSSLNIRSRIQDTIYKAILNY